MIVYKITNTINGKIYIGQTRYSLAHRWSAHALKSSKKGVLSLAIAKYGKDAFSKTILGEYETQEQTDDAEQYFIDFYNSIAPLGYNLAKGGFVNDMQHPATRAKMSANMMGAKNHQFGKKQSEETKAKRSAALKGRKRPSEVIAKIKANHNPKSNLNLTFNRK